MKHKKLAKIIEKLTNGNTESFSDGSATYVTIKYKKYLLEFLFNHKGTKMTRIDLYKRAYGCFDRLIASADLRDI